MEGLNLLPNPLALPGCTLAAPQRAGALTVVPIIGPDIEGTFAPPLSGLKLAGVRTYGEIQISHQAENGVAILPLHMGYIQNRAQNHALCGSAFLAPGQTRLFDDACCVQAGQGGYLEDKEQWFFILPLHLREAALELRGKRGYSKLWEDISWLNGHFRLPHRGHLEQIVSRQRAYLNQYQSRFERVTGQIGAVFLLRNRLAGIEIAPTAAYFAEVWMPLVCFAYGVAAMYEEQLGEETFAPFPPFTARSLPELRGQLARRRQDAETQVRAMLAAAPHDQFESKEAERLLDYRLTTLTGRHFVGQIVEVAASAEKERGLLGRFLNRNETGPTAKEGARTVYASLFARREYILGGK